MGDACNSQSGCIGREILGWWSGSGVTKMEGTRFDSASPSRPAPLHCIRLPSARDGRDIALRPMIRVLCQSEGCTRRVPFGGIRLRWQSEPAERMKGRGRQLGGTSESAYSSTSPSPGVELKLSHSVSGPCAFDRSLAAASKMSRILFCVSASPAKVYLRGR